MTELKDRVEKELAVMEKIKINELLFNNPSDATIDIEGYFRAVELIKDQQSRITELKTLVSDIYEDLKMRAQFTDDPKVLDISNGIFMRMAEVLESIKGG